MKLGGAELEAAYAGCHECAGRGGDLFGKSAAGACSNPLCFLRRVAAYVAFERQKDPDLLLLSGEYGQAEKYGDAQERVYSRSEYTEAGNRGKKCPNARRGIIVSGAGAGHKRVVCVATDCKVHRNMHTSYEPTPAEKAKRREERKRELETQRAVVRRGAAAMKRAVEAIPWPLSDQHAQAFLDAILACTGFTEAQQVCRRRDIKVKNIQHGAALARLARDMAPGDRFRLGMELLVGVQSSEAGARLLRAFAAPAAEKRGK